MGGGRNSPDSRILGGPRGEEKECREEKTFKEVVAENSPNLVKDITLQIQEVQWTPPRINSNNTTPRHIIIKLPKTKGEENSGKQPWRGGEEGGRAELREGGQS